MSVCVCVCVASTTRTRTQNNNIIIILYIIISTPRIGKQNFKEKNTKRPTTASHVVKHAQNFENFLFIYTFFYTTSEQEQ